MEPAPNSLLFLILIASVVSIAIGLRAPNPKGPTIVELWQRGIRLWALVLGVTGVVVSVIGLVRAIR